MRETITLSALLRLSQAMSHNEKMNRVEDVITELGLAKCANTLVGNELVRGISGGEKKRCNIGTELVSQAILGNMGSNESKFALVVVFLNFLFI